MTAKSVTNKGVVFRFLIEAGRGMKRERFEWRRSTEDGVAWMLVRCPGSSRKVPPEGEIIAKLSWVPVLFATVLHPLSPKSIFTLQFMNSLESGALGERCALTVVIFRTSERVVYPHPQPLVALRRKLLFTSRQSAPVLQSTLLNA
ncbi:hypothetical protein V8C42DRAFT_328242 [Trichoderma barbatum]